MLGSCWVQAGFRLGSGWVQDGSRTRGCNFGPSIVQFWPLDFAILAPRSRGQNRAIEGPKSCKTPEFPRIEGPKSQNSPGCDFGPSIVQFWPLDLQFWPLDCAILAPRFAPAWGLNPRPEPMVPIPEPMN